MKLLKSIGNILAGGKRQKGESQSQYNERSSQAYRDSWVQVKKQSGKWLSKEEYEKKTGKIGRKD